MPLITDYRKLFGTQDTIKKQLKILCPELDDKPGIYFWYREDHEGKHIYIGIATISMLERSISHCMGYKQRLDISIKKRGFYSKENKLGWQLKIMYKPVEELDALEQYYINKYVELGYDVYNISGGGQHDRAEDINERKEGRGYHDGLKQGEMNARREVAHWFDISLDYSIKGKPNLNKQKAYDRFTEFIKIEKENNQENKEEKDENGGD